MVRYLNLLILALTIGMNQAALAALNATIDRTHVELGETLTLTISTDNVKFKASPDLSSLQKDFEVLGQSQSSSVNFINFKKTSKTEWHIQLAPKREGTLIIPEFSIDQESSQPITVTVKKSLPMDGEPDSRPVFLELIADETTGYVQQQQTITARFYHRVPITQVSGFDLAQPFTSVHPLGEPRSYQKNVGDELVNVYEQSFALFPEHSGTLTVGPITMQAVGPTSNSRHSFFQDSRRYQPTSSALELTILPQDPNYTGQVWLPAESLQMNDHWTLPDDRWKVGDAVTLTFEIKATGLTGSQLPNITFDLPSEFRVYPEEPTHEMQARNKKMIGRTVQQVAVIPTKAGNFTLPPVSITWFNTQTKQAQTTTLPARQITVTLPAQLAGDTPLAPSSDALPQPANQRPAAGNNHGTVWFSLFIAALLVWLATLLGWFLHYRHHKKRASSGEDSSSKTEEKSTQQAKILRKLYTTCKLNQARESRELLLQWCHLSDLATSSLQEWAQKTGDPALLSAVNSLEAYLYAQTEDSPSWNGKELWDQLNAYLTKQTEKSPAKPNPLPPLSTFD